MDWYNTALWAHRSGAYTVWGSVYPPISFVFLRLFSNPACYYNIGLVARNCDHLGVFVLFAFFIANIILLFFIYRNNDLRTAVPRALALGLGMPMLFALDRGNLILPCFTFFILGHGRFLKSAWARWLCLAASINFKPYLGVSVVGGVLRRRWRWAEGCALAILAVYGVSLALYGAGSPGQLVQNIFGVNYSAPGVRLESIIFSTTYSDILKLLKAPFPLMYFIGSRPIETMEHVFPAAMRLGELGVLACFAGVVWRPNSVAAYRLAAMSIALVLTLTEPGGYSPVFLFFLVFLERWNGIGQAVALMSTYILCIPFDYPAIHLAHDVRQGYLSGHAVSYDLSIPIGAFIRPGLLLLIEYGLVVASVSDILRFRRGADPGVVAPRLSQQRERPA